MYKTVLAIVEHNQSNWSNIPTFATLVGEFATKLQELEHFSLSQASALPGITATKDALRKRTTEQARVILGALKAHAMHANDVGLAERANLSQSDLNRLPQLGFTQKLDEIIQWATENLAALNECGVDQAMVAELQNQRNACEVAFLAPRQAIADRKTHTESIRQRIKSLDLLLKKGLDGLMMTFKASAPDFYFHYKATRNIVDVRGKGKTGSDPETVTGADGD